MQLIKAIQRPRFLWTCDLLGLSPGQAIEDQNPAYDRTQYRLIASGLFDHIFLRTQNCIETVVSRGWAKREHCSILSSGFDPGFHRPRPEIEKDIDVLFLAAFTPRRRQIVDFARKYHPIQTASAYGADMVSFINRAKIVLNIHRGPLPDTENRVHEVLGCGAFLLTEQLPPEDPFSERDLVQFSSAEDMVEKIGYYLTHDEEREAIARRGHETALEGHTYMHRACQVIETMSKYTPSNDSDINNEPMLKRDRDLYRYAISEYGQGLKTHIWGTLYKYKSIFASFARSNG